VISAKIHSSNVRRLKPEIAKNSLKSIFGLQGRSKSSMLVPTKGRQEYLLW